MSRPRVQVPSLPPLPSLKHQSLTIDQKPGSWGCAGGAKPKPSSTSHSAENLTFAEFLLGPGRVHHTDRSSVHVMNLPTSKQNHGYIGIRDFRGDAVLSVDFL